ncbi:MAG: hypothetical protein DLM58_15150 [Pseudonocardiales bacterium]|nr:MAG: hypothetical protein DLM58_15150 [Pseudonocardiales bacterium]
MPADAVPVDAMQVDAGPADPISVLSAERIAVRVAALDSAGALPLTEHVELYQRLHGELQSALAEIDNP